jgi:putative membrane protein
MKLRLLTLAGLFAAVSFCSCDNDDDDNNVVMLNSTDSSFVIMAGMGNTAEIQTSQLADSTRSIDTSIQSFAQMMIMDHTASQNELKPLATKLGLTAPDTVDSAHTALKTILMALSGRAFDSVYIHNQVLDHQRTIEFFEEERDNGNNAELKNFAAGKLPSLQMHLDSAQAIAAGY